MPPGVPSAPVAARTISSSNARGATVTVTVTSCRPISSEGAHQGIHPPVSGLPPCDVPRRHHSSMIHHFFLHKNGADLVGREVRLEVLGDHEVVVAADDEPLELAARHVVAIDVAPDRADLDGSARIRGARFERSAFARFEGGPQGGGEGGPHTASTEHQEERESKEDRSRAE